MELARTDKTHPPTFPLSQKAKENQALWLIDLLSRRAWGGKSDRVAGETALLAEYFRVIALPLVVKAEMAALCFSLYEAGIGVPNPQSFDCLFQNPSAKL